MHEYETENNAAIWLKVKLTKRKYIFILCTYRQWKLPPELDPARVSNNLEDQLQRLDQILEPLDNLAAQGNLVLAAGDLNIDHMIANDPRSRFDIRKLHEKLDVSKDYSNLE